MLDRCPYVLCVLMIAVSLYLPVRHHMFLATSNQCLSLSLICDQLDFNSFLSGLCPRLVDNHPGEESTFLGFHVFLTSTRIFSQELQLLTIRLYFTFRLFLVDLRPLSLGWNPFWRTSVRHLLRSCSMAMHLSKVTSNPIRSIQISPLLHQLLRRVNLDVGGCSNRKYLGTELS
jgi:hypothetical protein